MVTEQIRPKHLSEYVRETYDVDSIEDVENNSILFEALAETIVNYNPDSTVEDFADEFDGETKEEARQFAEAKFDALVHESAHDLISIAHRNKWIESTAVGIMEYRAIKG